MNYTRSNKFLVILILFTVIVFIVSSILVKPSMYSDSGWGFITMKSMLNGESFNHVNSPSNINISKNISSFNNTWTPGQYIFSYYLIKYLGISLGTSIIIVVSLMSITGLTGLFLLFNHLKIPKFVILISLLVIALQRYFSLPFSIYNGGEVIIFGFFPWLTWLAITFNKENFVHFILLILIGVFGFFLKTSFSIIFLSICFYLMIKTINPISLNIREIIIKSIFILSVILISVGICYFFFLKNGIYSAQKFNFSFQPINSLFVLSHILGSAFSLDDLFKRIFEFPGNQYSPFIIKYASLIYYGFISVLSFYSIYQLKQLKNLNDYKKLCICFVIAYTAIFLIFYNKSEITGSLEMRHFRPVGLLFIPGIILFIKENIKKYSVVITFSSIILLSSLYGITSFAQRKYSTSKNASIGEQNFSHEIIDAETLKVLLQLDKKSNENEIIYVTSPEIGLEIKHARVIISSADFETENELSKKKYNGRVKHIYLCYQSRFENSNKEKLIINSFKSYNKFQILHNNNTFKIIELK